VKSSLFREAFAGQQHTQSLQCNTAVRVLVNECITIYENTETIFTTLIKVLLLFKSLIKVTMFCILLLQLLTIFMRIEYHYGMGYNLSSPFVKGDVFLHPVVAITLLNLFKLNDLFLDYCHEIYQTRCAQVALKSESEISSITDIKKGFDLVGRIISVSTAILSLIIYVRAFPKKEITLSSHADKNSDEDQQAKQYRLRLIEENKQEWRNHWMKRGGSKQNAMLRSLEKYPQWLIVEMEEIEAEQSDAQKRQQAFAKRIATNSWSNSGSIDNQKERTGSMAGFYNPTPSQSQPGYTAKSFKTG